MIGQETEDLYHESKQSSSIDPEPTQCLKRGSSLTIYLKCEEWPKYHVKSMLAERKTDTICLLERLAGAK